MAALEQSGLGRSGRPAAFQVGAHGRIQVVASHVTAQQVGGNHRPQPVAGVDRFVTVVGDLPPRQHVAQAAGVRTARKRQQRVERLGRGGMAALQIVEHMADELVQRVGHLPPLQPLQPAHRAVPAVLDQHRHGQPQHGGVAEGQARQGVQRRDQRQVEPRQPGALAQALQPGRLRVRRRQGGDANPGGPAVFVHLLPCQAQAGRTVQLHQIQSVTGPRQRGQGIALAGAQGHQHP